MLLKRNGKIVEDKSHSEKKKKGEVSAEPTWTSDSSIIVTIKKGAWVKEDKKTQEFEVVRVMYHGETKKGETIYTTILKVVA